MKVSAKDVIAFFKNSGTDLELAEMTYELAGTEIAARKAVRDKISQNLKKARAAKGQTQAKAAVPAAASRQAGKVTIPRVPAPPTIRETAQEETVEAQA